MRLLLFLSLLSIVPFVSAEECTDTRQLIDDMLKWFVEKGGRISPKLEFRVTGEGCDKTFEGMFAKEDISDKETLLVIPKETVIHSGDPVNVDRERLDFECETVHAVLREMKLGNKSAYAPYLNYLMVQDRNALPGFWSEAGRAFFHRLLAFPTDVDPTIGWIPPNNPTGLMSDWLEVCENSDDDWLSLQALSQVATRSWDAVMLPIFELFNHRNGDYRNVDSTRIDPYEEQDITVFTIRPIEQGEQLYNSYNECGECDGRATYGTPQILRDYGFIEDYPQKWIIFFHPKTFEIELGFEVVEEDGEISLVWIADEVDQETEEYIIEQQERLEDLEDKFVKRPEDIPQHEWDRLVRFYESVRFVFDRAVEELALMEEVEVYEDEL